MADRRSRQGVVRRSPGDPMRVVQITVLTALITIAGLVPTPGLVEATAGARMDVLIAVPGAVPDPSRAAPARIRKVRDAIRAQARALGVTPHAIFTTGTRAFSTSVTSGERARLLDDRRVLDIEDDTLMDGTAGLDDSGSKVIGRPARERPRGQVRPLWMKRIGALAVEPRLGTAAAERSPRFDADVAIIDSGIGKHHPDVHPAGGKDCTHSGTWADGYGHGLGVASILGAKDNGKGVVGMLPGVRLWSVRIFDSKGRTRPSWILCGLDYVANKRDRRDRHKPFFEGATLSFSIGGLSRKWIHDTTCGRRSVDLFHQAICRIEHQGTILVAAAGNYGQKAALRRPAGYPEVITVSAMADFDGKLGGRGRQSRACRSGSARERDDAFASFSDYGVGVDLIAPGKCIWVAFPGRTYARVTGTSFAAPIVLGAALLYRQRYPRAQPNQVRMALIHAGRRDWKVWSDPDRHHEPRVDVRHFAPPPTFRYAHQARRTIRRGDSRTVTLRARRRFGHTAHIDIRVVHAPRGVRVTIDGSRVTIKVRGSAIRGRSAVTLRASDGEVVRTIRLPIRIRPAHR